MKAYKTLKVLSFLIIGLGSKAHAILGIPDNVVGLFSMPRSVPELNIDRNSVTVSGISSGGFMAVQLGVAYSSEIKGVGVVAGGIYDCSEGKMSLAKDMCMKNPARIDVTRNVQRTMDFYKDGLIDNPQNIRNQNIFVLQGTEDAVVGREGGPKLAEYYSNLGAKVETEFKIKSGHGFPVLEGHGDCNVSKPPWVNGCKYSAAGAIFKSMYGPMKSPTNKNKQTLLSISQFEFGADQANMLGYAQLYVPEQCKDSTTQCRLHVAMHGCMQSPNAAGLAFVEDAGYNEWAEANNIGVLYPAAATTMNNPAGCWDWFGYTGKNYAVKSSKQAQVIMAMVHRLLGNK